MNIRLVSCISSYFPLLTLPSNLGYKLCSLLLVTKVVAMMDIFQQYVQAADPIKAVKMAAYMKDHFPFLGLPRPEQVKLSKPFLQTKKNETTIDWEFIFLCYQKPEREFQYLAIDYLAKMKKKLHPDDMIRLEELITTKSWWDTTDSLDNIVGYMYLQFPQIKETILCWIDSENIWLKRVSINFQLAFKEKTDTELLERAICSNLNTNEFFVDKAIGWSLREYSKTNKEWVAEFIQAHPLSKLSVREASKYL
ncbi:DNA alkylation repair protein [Brevibacillus daliensis]|uniref:DNA alkylation repair protein n=1 Tax=Brevibacillus daliensis TaxID=2892995 RepID=UPI001E5FE095|nr:DNA alkylation repair protein [Brevibacillus daliensis]